MNIRLDYLENDSLLFPERPVTNTSCISRTGLVIWTTINQGMFEIGTNFLLKIKFGQYIIIEGLIM